MNGMSMRLWQAIAALWQEKSSARLPERVATAIAQNDDTSEILVKLIQLLVFSLWFLAWLAAPQPNPDTISKVPLVLSLYLAITLLMLLVALAQRLPVWLIYLSILFDMVLLTYLIWTFHLQYAQPASFSLKVVEVVNYFVLIGMRALRFEARYVIAAGATAIACWAAHVFYVTQIDPADSMITHDYVTYLTSNHVLIGAEVSKMLSMLMFTAISSLRLILLL